jgi:transcriptional regulator with XRE-family HTH domain
VKQNTYSLWEHGKGLTSEQVGAIAKVLDVPPDELGSPEPVSLSLTNNHADNGYMSIQNQQQQTVPMEIVERLMGESRERARMLEELIKAQMEVLRELVKKSRYKDRH